MNGRARRLVPSRMTSETNRDDVTSGTPANAAEVGGGTDVAGGGVADGGETLESSGSTPRKRGRWKKVLLALVLLAGGVVALAPTIAGWVAPGIVASSIKIPGSITIEKMSLGWLSPQAIGPVVIRGKDAKAGEPPIVTMTIKTPRGLLGLLGVARGSFDIGTIEGTGTANIVRYADGTTNLERALGVGSASTSGGSASKPSSGAAGPIKVPSGLDATLNLTNMSVTFTDERAAGGPKTVSLVGGTLTAVIQSGAGGLLNTTFSTKVAEGSPAIGNGTIAGSVKAEGFVGADGVLTLDKASVDSNLAMSEVPSGIADAFAPALPNGASIATTLGPTLGLTLNAKGSAGKISGEISSVAKNLLVSGEFALADKALTLTKPLSVRVAGEAARALSPVVEGLLRQGDEPVRLEAVPSLTLVVDSVRLPLDLANPGKIDLRGGSVDLRVGVGEGSIGTRGSVKLGSERKAFALEPLTIRVQSQDFAKGVSITGGTKASIANQPAGVLTIALNAKNLLDDKGAPASGMPVVLGEVGIASVSTSLVQAFVPQNVDLSQDLGPTVDVVLKAQSDIAAAAVKGTAPGGASSGTFDLSVRAEKATLSARAGVARDSFTLEAMQANVRVSPETAARLAPGDARLTGPLALKVELGGQGFTVPLKGSEALLRKASPLELTISSAGAGVTGLSLAGEDGVKKPLGDVGVRDLSGTMRVDVAALLPDPSVIPGTLPADGGVQGKAEMEVSGTLTGPRGATLGTLRLGALAPLNTGNLGDAIKASVAIENMSPAVAQSILPEGTVKAGMLAGALGESVGVSVQAAITTPGKDLKNLDAANASISAAMKITGDRVSTVKPLVVSVGKDRVSLMSPGEIRLGVDPAWANATFLTATVDPSLVNGRADVKSLTLMEATSATLSISKLVVAKPVAGVGDVAAVGPFKAGVFDVELDVLVPKVVLKKHDGKRIELVDLDLHAVHPKDAMDGTINAALTGKAGAAATGADAATLADIDLAISATKLATPSGVIDLSQGTLNVGGNLEKFPTPLLDIVLNQNGALQEFVGDTADVRLKAQNISLAGAKDASPLDKALVDVSVSSSRVSLTAAGKIEGGAFVASAPIEMQLTEVTAAAGGFINAAVPAIGSIEKRAGTDRPAKVVISNLVYPIDGKFERFDGAFNIDPGEARFASSTAFGEILKVVKQRTEGEVGTKLEPLMVGITKGEIAIPKYNIPLGEFTVGTEGSINLATRTVNVVTWIPFGALSDKAAGLVKLNSGVGSAIGRVLPIEGITAIPFRTSGTFAKTGTTLDAELLAKNLIDTVRPDKVIERLPELIPGGIPKFPDLFPRKKEEPKPAETAPADLKPAEPKATEPKPK